MYTLCTMHCTKLTFMYLIHFNPCRSLANNNYYYPHFVKETETQSYSIFKLHDILGYALHITPYKIGVNFIVSLSTQILCCWLDTALSSLLHISQPISETAYPPFLAGPGCIATRLALQLAQNPPRISSKFPMGAWTLRPDPGAVAQGMRRSGPCLCSHRKCPPCQRTKTSSSTPLKT